jgi:hypothetical protein
MRRQAAFSLITHFLEKNMKERLEMDQCSEQKEEGDSYSVVSLLQ